MIASLATEEIQELDPVKLLNLTSLKREDFAEAMGVQKQTLDTWCAGIKNPSRQARRLAAELHRNWKATGRI